MSAFEDRLNFVAIREEVDIQLLFEVFMLKKTDSPYTFISISDDLERVIDFSRGEYRYIAKTVHVKEIKKFLGITISIIEGKLHTMCARIDSKEKNSLQLIIFGHDEYDLLKRYTSAFINKYPEISVHLILENPKTEYVYPELETKGFWKIFKELFIKTHSSI